eukprot:9489095-Pyramimonas_sp.AAC.1
MKKRNSSSGLQGGSRAAPRQRGPQEARPGAAGETGAVFWGSWAVRDCLDIESGGPNSIQKQPRGNQRALPPSEGRKDPN